MTTAKRIAVLLLSVGWIAPLCAAYAVGRNFVWFTHRIAVGSAQAVPWHPFELMGAFFYGSMLWLALVISGWTLWLTRRR